MFYEDLRLWEVVLLTNLTDRVGPLNKDLRLAGWLAGTYFTCLGGSERHICTYFTCPGGSWGVGCLTNLNAVKKPGGSAK